MKCRVANGTGSTRSWVCSLSKLCWLVASIPDMVFKYLDILGESTKGFEEAVQNAIAETAMTVKDIRWAEISSFKVMVSGDKITEYQALMRVAFKVKR